MDHSVSGFGWSLLGVGTRDLIRCGTFSTPEFAPQTAPWLELRVRSHLSDVSSLFSYSRGIDLVKVDHPHRGLRGFESSELSMISHLDHPGSVPEAPESGRVETPSSRFPAFVSIHLLRSGKGMITVSIPVSTRF